MKLTKSIFLSFAFATATVFVSCDGKKDDAENSGAKDSEATAVVDTPDSLTDELIVQMNKLGDTLLGAKDKASAEAAVEKLSAIGKDITAIANRMDKLETPSEEKQKALDAKMDAAQEAMEDKMKGFMANMGNPDVAQIIGPAMQEFGKSMSENDKVFERFGKKK